MPRKPAFSLAYSHEMALASQMAFAVPAGVPARMQAILDQLDAPRPAPRQLLAERLAAIRQLIEAEAADAQGAACLQA